MFKKINLATHASAFGIISFLFLYGYYSKHTSVFPLIGITLIGWFLAVFCSHRKTVKKRKMNPQE